MATDETVGIIETPRTVDVLLNCSTYQGMTDVEIQSLIDYWQSLGYEKGYKVAREEGISEAFKNAQAVLEDAAAKSTAAFEAACKISTTFEAVTFE